MTLDGETLDALQASSGWEEQMRRLAERAHPHGGSVPTVGGDAPAKMLSCAVAGDVMAAIDGIAARRGVSRSDLVRVGLLWVLHVDAEGA
jgi:hypothetical protein